jgi:two-component system, cell cycle sensor histidine kinase and response regulator CckA
MREPTPPDPERPPAAEPRLTEAAIRRLLDLAGDTVWSISADGRITYVSPAVERTRGYTPAEAMTQSIEQIHTPESIAKNMQYWGELAGDLAAGRPPRTFRGDMEYRCKDGSTFWSEVFCYPVLDEAGNFAELVGISRDIAVRRAQEARERAEERLEAAGRMAAGVAHEVNNALGVIRAATDLLPATVQQDPASDLGPDAIRGAVERVAGVMTQLLSFSGRRHVAPVLLSADEAVTGFAARLAQAAAPSRFRVELADGVNEALIAADRVQWEQLLLHLVQNARDAAGATGEVRLIVQRRVLTTAQPMRSRAVPPGEYLEVLVQDTGPGIPEAILARVFDPFFTTKPQDQGIGLGLPTVLGIAQQHGAGVQIQSRLGQGTAVQVLWPIAAPAEPVAPRPSAATPIAKQRHGKRRVLLVDDEPMLLSLTMRLLEHLGYSARGASGAEAALAMLAAEPDAFDLLITDIRMPGLSGTELVAEMLARGIDMPVLFVSGQIDAPIPTTWAAAAPHRFLAKPYPLERLGEELRALSVA